jgi:hypothetical protein
VIETQHPPATVHAHTYIHTHTHTCMHLPCTLNKLLSCGRSVTFEGRLVTESGPDISVQNRSSSSSFSVVTLRPGHTLRAKAIWENSGSIVMFFGVHVHKAETHVLPGMQPAPKPLDKHSAHELG